MSLRRLATLCTVMTLGCSPSSGGLPTEEPGGFRAIHIVRDGNPLPPVVRLGALGGVQLDIALEDVDGALHPRGAHRVSWGSTNPGVADAAEEAGSAYIRLNRNGEARIIAHFDGLRDTVTLQIAQVAALGTLVADTVVTLSPNARDLSGAPSAYHGFRYAAVRLDSTGHPVDSRQSLVFEAIPEGFVDIVPEAVGDTVAIFGNLVGSGSILVRLGEVVDTIPVQVSGAYRVVRLVETPSNAYFTVPETVQIPRGAAVVFQNETRHTTLVQSFIASGWRAGWIQPNGRQAQLFSRTGAYDFFWPAGVGAVIVTP